MQDEQVHRALGIALTAEAYGHLALKGMVQAGLMPAEEVGLVLDAIALKFEQFETMPGIANGPMFQEARERIATFVGNLPAIEAEGLALRAYAAAPENGAG